MCGFVAFFDFKDICESIIFLCAYKVSCAAAVSDRSAEVKYRIESTGT